MLPGETSASGVGMILGMCFQAVLRNSGGSALHDVDIGNNVV